mmetsp:Transcript_40306/g.110990  ORF Transcript_40306/g.110990 Transcript_40306/m.110990 type:complete len:204 (+) Transcript_40306:1133-1744(+)
MKVFRNLATPSDFAFTTLIAFDSLLPIVIQSPALKPSTVFEKSCSSSIKAPATRSTCTSLARARSLTATGSKARVLLAFSLAVTMQPTTKNAMRAHNNARSMTTPMTLASLSFSWESLASGASSFESGAFSFSSGAFSFESDEATSCRDVDNTDVESDLSFWHSPHMLPGLSTQKGLSAGQITRSSAILRSNPQHARSPTFLP